jgi:hypothetical protein
VVFGITGDLAKKMTFRSLYRLERRRMIDCPIIGVARDEWSATTLREHARKAIEDCGENIDHPDSPSPRNSCPTPTSSFSGSTLTRARTWSYKLRNPEPNRQELSICR